ncbi:apolipoprotein N-acyltransferase [Geminicoccaceae bacterium 1502E]|nr:apolipoprotein N-acyltransferase [Geminicoccaceae bacterium 1502E]
MSTVRSLARPPLATALARPRLLALASGTAAALALPPLHVLPGLLGLALLLASIDRARRSREVLAIGWCWGFGFFLAGLYWVGIAFFTDVERFGALAVPAVLLLAAACAVFPALVCWLTWRARLRSPLARTLFFAVAWTASEALRGPLGADFPWNPLAIVWAPFDAMLQPAAWIGGYGLSFLTVLLACLPATLLLEGGQGRRQGVVLAGLLLALWLGAGGTRLLLASPDGPPGPALRIVQGAIEQHHKWDPDKRAAWFRRHLELSAAPSPLPLQIVIWPESAVPYLLAREPAVRGHLAQVTPPGGMLLVGGDDYQMDAAPPLASNSLFAIDERGEIAGRYDKADLVPFGEYLPLRWLLGRLGLQNLTAGSIDFVPGPGRETLAPGDVPPFSPLICYEAIFPGSAIDPQQRPDWLLNITNDAWFGRSSGPYQHLAMARLRAVEEGLPLVRAANTGISVVTDALGRVVERLDLGRMGVIDTRLPPPLLQPTLFRSHGALLHGMLFGFAALCGMLLERRRRSGEQ